MSSETRSEAERRQSRGEMPYTGTTSDGSPTHRLAGSRPAGMPDTTIAKAENRPDTSVKKKPPSIQAVEGERPARKIKPPSATFLQSAKANHSSDSSPEPSFANPEDAMPESHAAEEQVESASPAPEEPSSAPVVDHPEEELGGPAPAEAESALGGPPPVGAAEPELSGPAAAAPAAAAEGGEPLPEGRAQVELKELEEIVSSLESLKFLRPRLARCSREGADAATLVSFYRLTARTLLDELKQKDVTVEQFRANIHKMRGKLNQAEVQLAVAAASGKVPAPPLEDGEEGAAPTTDSAESQARIAKLEAELEKVNEQRERLLTDFQNMRNRAQMDTEIKIFREKEKFVGSLLPVLDSFGQAVASMKNSTDINSVVTGVEMIFGLLMDALQGQGLSEIQAVGQPFDPRFHEALGHVDTEDVPDDHVYDQYQPGYLLGERLLRAAMVRLARNASPAPPPPPPPAASEPSPEAEPAGESPGPEASEPPPAQEEGEGTNPEETTG